MAADTPSDVDPYLWLEEIEGAEALRWVETRSAATLERLRGDERFDSIYAHCRLVRNDPRAIPFPRLFREHVYNFWTDADHPRGLWRRTSRTSYLEGTPLWETLLDIDVLGRDEGVNWSWGGATILRPTGRHALVALSRGGGDAVVHREFDVDARRFVPGGFRVEETKGNAVWRDPDTLLVGAVLEPDDATVSGYPRRLRMWQRGRALADAPVVLETGGDDVALFAAATHTPSRTYVLAYRAVSMEAAEIFVLDGEAFAPLDLPLDADVTFFRDQLVVRLRSDWTVSKTTYPADSVLATNFEAFAAGRRELVVLEVPSATGTIESIAATRDTLVVNRLERVQNELVTHRLADRGWTRRKLPLPAGGTLDVVTADSDEPAWFFTYMSFLDPLTLFYVGGVSGASPVEVYRLPAYFDASLYVVRTCEATSRDGTRVPYFVVHSRTLARDGKRPTHLYGYGGFEVTQRPTYLAQEVEAWLLRGGVYAKACIRGGGELGPRWHRAALRENRQRAFDDFIAVAEDLIDAGYTSPPHLGITGGSNGGLLVGAVMTQRPELLGAVVASVPLFDMRRYHRLLAGASWMSEYGDPDDPDAWAYLSTYSPYQNLRADVRYPPLLLITSTRDDRVHPGHARKMAAKLEAMGHSVTYHENTEGGHAAGATPDQLALNAALTYVFLLRALGQPLERKA